MCEYCEGDTSLIINAAFIDVDELVVLDSEFFEEESVKIYYCPMCGNQLGED